MKRLSSILAVVAVVGSLAFCRSAPAEEWSDHLTVKAEKGEDGKLQVIFEAASGWYVNTAYPGTKVTLKAPEDGELEQSVIKKDAAKFEEESEGDKAKRARFETAMKDKKATPKALEGEYKTVVCSKTTCSPPFKSEFKAELKSEGDS